MAIIHAGWRDVYQVDDGRKDNRAGCGYFFLFGLM